MMVTQKSPPKRKRKVRHQPRPLFKNDERLLLITDLIALKKNQIGTFLASHNLARSGKKEDLRARVEDAIDKQSLTLEQIVEFLDSVIPWGKQHVFLFDGPKTDVSEWRDCQWVARLLKKRRCENLLNAQLPLILPKCMTLSSIVHDGSRLRITAVKRRDWWERDSDYDDRDSTENGEDVDLRAFIHRVTRSLVAFEWNLTANVASLQISQLPTGVSYDMVRDEFFELIESWLSRSLFSPVDLAPAIKSLHEKEKSGEGETRSHGINYRTLEGRRFEGKSASASDPLLGEEIIDAALTAVSQTGIGYLGNFYWLPGVADGNGNPLDRECHVIVFAFQKRINFTTPNTEETVRYVLSRIRRYCS